MRGAWPRVLPPAVPAVLVALAARAPAAEEPPPALLPSA